MTMQSMIRYRLPESKPSLWADDFKEMLAKELDGKDGVEKTVFYFDGNSAIPTGEPDIKFVGGKHWVGVLSMSSNDELLLKLATSIGPMLYKHFNEPIPMLMENRELALERLERPITYFVRNMLVKRGQLSNRTSTSQDLLLDRLCRRLIWARDNKNFDLPIVKLEDIFKRLGNPADEKALARAKRAWEHENLEKIAKYLSIEVHESREIGVPVRYRNNPEGVNKYAALISGTFSMNAKLSGWLQIGNLQSRGFGRIIREGGPNAK